MTAHPLLPHLRALYASRVTDYFGRNNSLVREPLTDAALLGHLEGRWRVGTYLDRGDGTVLLGVIDLDNREDPDAEKWPARRCAEVLAELGLNAEVFSSKSKGYHVVVFFAEPAPARTVRAVLKHAARIAGRENAEIFPKQDRVYVYLPPPGSQVRAKVGSYINLPFHGASLRKGRTALLDRANGLDPYPDQLAAVERVRKTSVESLAAAAAAVGEATPAPRSAPPGTEKVDLDLVRSALSHLDAADRETWREVGMALKYHVVRGDVADGDAYGTWDAWSRTTTAGNYDARDQARHWEHDFDRKEGNVVTVRTIFKRAHDRGWERPSVVLRTDEPAYVARRYAEVHGDVWHWRGDFYEWTGAWWRPLSEDDLNARLWTWLEHARLRKGDEGGRRYRPDKTKVNHVLAALSGVRHQGDVREAPFWTEPREGDPRPTDLLPFHNGVLDLRTLTLREPDPRLFALHRCDCIYDPAAEAPRWDEFQREIFPDDESSARCIEEILGYCLANDTSQQKAFLFQGVRRSGKGTILRVLRRLVGPDRWTAPTITQFSHSDFGMQPLIGKAVAAISDARGQDARNPHVVTERILTVTGEDAVSVNRKNKTFWEGVLPTRILYVSNVSPKMSDPSGVIVSRFVAIHFKVSFEDREDTNLTDKLLAEMPGIVNRALAGLVRLRRRGRFEQPETGKPLLALMDELTSPVRAFVDEMCEVGPEREVYSQFLYDAFCEWCEANGHKRMASSTFGRDLFALGRGIAKGRAKVRHPETGEQVNGPQVYRGIKLVEWEVPC